MTEKKIKISPAKGRPMLYWIGKRPLDYVKGFPAQLTEIFNPAKKSSSLPFSSSTKGEKSKQKVIVTQHFDKSTGEAISYDNLKSNWHSLLFHGDNKDVLATLLEAGFRGKIDLIYIDPPFKSGADYIRKVELRGLKDLGRVEQDQASFLQQTMYFDIWNNDTYLQFMYERLMLLKELLSENGSIYVHLDWHVGHSVKLLMDEVFGQDNFNNEIIWKRTTSKGGSEFYNHVHDIIYFYSKSNNVIWNQLFTDYTEEYITSMFRNMDPDGRKWRESPLTAPGLSAGKSGEIWKGINPALIGRGRHWAIPGYIRSKLSKAAQVNTIDALNELKKMGRIVWSREGDGIPNFKQYIDEREGVELQSIWMDIGGERSDFVTGKPKSLLERIIKASSNPGDLVLDCFIGSGTTAAVAQKLGRRWIGCDINKGAIQMTSKRLQKIIMEQIEEEQEMLKQVQHDKEDEIVSSSSTPRNDKKKKSADSSALHQSDKIINSFAMYKVNDYDLHLLKTEATELAVQHIGIQRTKTDAFFEGFYGKSLAKIIDFNHPLILLDLQLIQDELKKRPDEERDITVVCLGKESAVDPWVVNWNKKHPVNKIRIIELKTDAKYGNFLVHKPVEAEIEILRVVQKKSVIASSAARNDKPSPLPSPSKGEDKGEGEIHNDIAVITIKAFISPTIIERLNIDQKVWKVKIPDFRAMIDTVLIDANYDGKIFNIIFSDVPEKKADLIRGTYEIEIPKKKTNIAVKIIDMLGEELLYAKEI